MTRLLLITLLLLSSAPAYAEWVAVTGNKEAGMTAYIDPDTIRRKGNLVKMWELLDFKKAQTEGNLSVLSSKVQKEYDCAEERHRMLAFIDYSDNMGRGNVVHSDSTGYNWEPIAPDTIDLRMWKRVCMMK